VSISYRDWIAWLAYINKRSEATATGAYPVLLISEAHTEKHDTYKKEALVRRPCKFFFRSFMQWDFEVLNNEFDVRLVNACFNVHDSQGTLKTPYSSSQALLG
jgi:hypothetical protein